VQFAVHLHTLLCVPFPYLTKKNFLFENRTLNTFRELSSVGLFSNAEAVPRTVYTDKKKRKFSPYIGKFSGAVANSYMRKGFLIYDEIRKYLVIYDEAVSHI
jgi:hypothetical protein